MKMRKHKRRQAEMVVIGNQIRDMRIQFRIIHALEVDGKMRRAFQRRFGI